MDMTADKVGSTVADHALAGLSRADFENMIGAVSRLSGLLDSSVIATKAAQEARRLADVDLVGIAVVEGRNSIVMMGTAGGTSEWFSRLRMDVDIGVGFAGTILATRLPLIFNPQHPDRGIFAYDAADGAVGDPVLGPVYATHLKQRISPEGLSEYIGVPIELNGQILGLLYAGNRKETPSPDRNRAILARFAGMIAPALSSARSAREAAVAELNRERERIALSLHDTIGQILFGIGAGAKRGQAFLSHDDIGKAAGELTFVELEASRAAAHLREILRNLGERPAEQALDNEVRILAGMFSNRTGIPADVIVSGPPRCASPEVFTVLVAMTREGLHNVEKHAGASAVIVSLHYGSDRITLSVQDDGRGVGRNFQIGPDSGDGSRLGLSSLRRRVERIGGEFVLHGRSDGGCTLRGTV